MRGGIALNWDQLDGAAARYVENGSPALKAERQRDVDGARTFLLDAACEKFRIKVSPPAATPGLTADRRSLLPAVGEEQG